ncbi:FmdC precursor [Enhygromyxa salina]|uniref:FmdC n=1 Tax=Enhygromyxa salina TaxID=215803 RepID=A0A0C2A4Y7_9BACT|nr:porin [Enhygromyxa salina]KIG18473.1 FmdC precursor [Enhygromyxa salina]
MNLSILSLFSLLSLAPPADAAASQPDAPVAVTPETDSSSTPAPEQPEQPVPSVDAPEPEPEPEPAPAPVPATPEPVEAPAEPASEDPGQGPPVQTAKPKADEDEVSPLVPNKQWALTQDVPINAQNIRFRPGKGLTFASKDDKYKLAMGLRVQMLYTLDHDNDAAPDVEPVTHTFQLRRARLAFQGNVFGEHNKYKLELSFSPRDISLKNSTAKFTILRDFYVEFDYLRNLTVRVGQYKLPYSHQRVISSGKLQLVDRSIVGSEFDLDRDIGIDIRSKDFLGVKRLRYYAGVYMGGGRDNYTLEPVAGRGGLVYIARIEVAPFGQFDDYTEGDFDRTKKPRLSLGVAYSYMDDAVVNRGTKGSTPTDGGTTDYHNANAGLQFKVLGLAISGEFFWRQGRRHVGDAEVEDELGNLVLAPIEAPRNGLGWFVQAGYMIPHAPIEVAARYSEIRALGTETETAISDRREAGGGLSWYIAGHPYKLQADYFRIWDDAIGRGLDEIRVQAQISF